MRLVNAKSARRRISIKHCTSIVAQPLLSHADAYFGAVGICGLTWHRVVGCPSRVCVSNLRAHACKCESKQFGSCLWGANVHASACFFHHPVPMARTVIACGFCAPLVVSRTWAIVLLSLGFRNGCSKNQLGFWLALSTSYFCLVNGTCSARSIQMKPTASLPLFSLSPAHVFFVRFLAPSCPPRPTAGPAARPRRRAVRQDAQTDRPRAQVRARRQDADLHRHQTRGRLAVPHAVAGPLLGARHSRRQVAAGPRLGAGRVQGRQVPDPRRHRRCVARPRRQGRQDRHQLELCV